MATVANTSPWQASGAHQQAKTCSKHRDTETQQNCLNRTGMEERRRMQSSGAHFALEVALDLGHELRLPQEPFAIPANHFSAVAVHTWRDNNNNTVGRRAMGCALGHAPTHQF